MEQYFSYLDELRESGVTNMVDLPVYLRNDFGLDEKDASEVFLAWMDYKKKEEQRDGNL